MNLSINPARYAPYLLGVLRIVTAFLFMQHGTAKLFGFPHVDMFKGLKLLSLLGAAGVLEIFGGALLLVGFLTRPTAFVLSGMMALAYFMTHFPKGALPILNQGESAVLFCFIFLFLTAAGPGRFAVDRS
jgi:putative oxidoreductase